MELNINMLQSIEKCYYECTNLLVNQKELYKITCIDFELLKELIKLLEPFEIATKELSKQNEPTLPYVYPWKEKLKKHINCFDCENSFELQQCLPILSEALETKYIIKDLHKVATIFDPRIKTMKNLCDNSEEKLRLHTLIVEDIRRLFYLDDDEKPLTDVFVLPETEPLPKKKRVNAIEEFFDSSPCSSTGATKILTVEEELDAYINLKKSI